MTALIIIGAIILLFAFLLHATVNAEIKYYGGKLDFKVTYLFLTLFPLKIKEKKEKKKKSKRKKDISAENTEITQTETPPEASSEEKNSPEELDEETKELLSGGEKKKKASSKDRLSDAKKKLEQLKIIWGFCKDPLIKLFGGVYIDDLVVDFKICGEDACQAAVNYGKVSAIFYNALNVVRTMFPMSVRTVDIVCDFDGKESVYDGECAVKLRLGTAVGALLVVLLGYIKNMNDINNAGVAEVDSDKEKAKA